MKHEMRNFGEIIGTPIGSGIIGYILWHVFQPEGAPGSYSYKECSPLPIIGPSLCEYVRSWREGEFIAMTGMVGALLGWFLVWWSEDFPE